MKLLLLSIAIIVIFGLIITEIEARAGGGSRGGGSRSRGGSSNRSKSGSSSSSNKSISSNGKGKNKDKSNDLNSDLSDAWDSVKKSTKKGGKKAKKDGKKGDKKATKQINNINLGSVNKSKSVSASNEVDNVVNDINRDIKKIDKDIKDDTNIIITDIKNEVNNVDINKDNIVNDLSINLNTLKVDPTKEFEADGKKVNVDNLLNNFKVNFEDNSPSKSTSTNSKVKKDVNIRKGKSKDDKNFDKLVKKVFGGGKNKHKPKRYSKNGKELKYYKDNSIPMMLRKVIPPRGGAKLPNLHFEYVEGNSICRCTCNL